MSKIGQYLQEHLSGEVLDSMEIRQQLSRDASVLSIVPLLAVYPRSELDVRKTTRFCWQLAERGRHLPITARGGGTSTTGAALGSGIVMVTTAHMNKILSLDPKKKKVVLEPGMSFDKLQQTLYTHGLFLPVAPSLGAYATVGGSLANNVSGKRSVKYGNLGNYVKSLKVVLSNGETIETGPLNKRELSHKMGLSSFEGHIYRTLDALLEENTGLIAKLPSGAGYNLGSVRAKDGCDLTPLFLGSQGSLGIIVEASLSLAEHNPEVAMAMLSLEKYDDLAQVLPSLLSLKPSMLDMLSGTALSAVSRVSPQKLSASAVPASCALHLFIEFDDAKASARKENIKKLSKLAERAGAYMMVANDFDDRQKIHSIRQSVATILMMPDGQARALPLGEDIQVPPENLANFIQEAESAFKASNMAAPMWGHAGSGIVRFYPQLDIAQVGDRQKFFKLMDALFASALKHGGALSASSEGRVKAPHTRRFYGDDFYKLTTKVKSIFDPHKILNPGVKTLSSDELLPLLRSDYSLAHFYHHLPRS